MFSLFIAIFGLCSTFPKLHALSACNPSIINAFLSRPQLLPTPLQFNFMNKIRTAGKTFWKTASTSDDLLDVASKIYYAPLENHVSKATLKYYNPKEITLNVTFTEHLGYEYLGYVLNDEFVGAYSFWCSKHLVAVYQCQKSGKSKAQKFLISTHLEIQESVIKEERELCKQKVREIDPTVKFTDHHHPLEA